MKRRLWLYAKWLAIAILIVCALPMAVWWKLCPYNPLNPINGQFDLFGKAHMMLPLPEGDISWYTGTGHYYLKYEPGCMDLGSRLDGDCENVKVFYVTYMNSNQHSHMMGGSPGYDILYEFDVTSVPATIVLTSSDGGYGPKHTITIK